MSVENKADQAAADQKAPPADQKAPPAKKTEARVLVATDEHAVDDIIAGEAAKVAVKAGWADDHPSAVAYAKSLRG